MQKQTNKQARKQREYLKERRRQKERKFVFGCEHKEDSKGGEDRLLGAGGELKGGNKAERERKKEKRKKK